MGRSVGEKAEQAVKNSQRVKGEAVTPEQNIKFLRDNLRAGLYVPNHQIAALLAEYDATVQTYKDVVGAQAEAEAGESI